jgi:hypothetical protein
VDRPLQISQAVEQSIVRRTPTQLLPESLDRIQLRAVAGQALELQVAVLRQHLIDRFPASRNGGNDVRANLPLHARVVPKSL